MNFGGQRNFNMNSRGGRQILEFEGLRGVTNFSVLSIIVFYHLGGKEAYSFLQLLGDEDFSRYIMGEGGQRICKKLVGQDGWGQRIFKTNLFFLGGGQNCYCIKKGAKISAKKVLIALPRISDPPPVK